MVFSHLDISSLFFKHIGKKTAGYTYHIDELVVFNVSTLAETFLAISNCYKVKDLAIEMEETSSSK